MSQMSIHEVVELIQNEVIPAEGCTEPIALAYAAAKTVELLGQVPEKMDVYASGNIIKNVKSVIVPNSGGMVGIEASVAMGAIAGDPIKDLMCISNVSVEDLKKVKDFLYKQTIRVFNANKQIALYIRIDAFIGDQSAVVEFKHTHTNITLIEKNSKVIKKETAEQTKNLIDNQVQTLSIAKIYEMAKNLDVSLVKDLFDKVITRNTNIAEKGLKDNYGACVGKSIKNSVKSGFYSDDIRNKSAYMAAAGSDARMGGCALPVMTVAGSGNNGITIALPISQYCKKVGASYETLYRALFFAILTTVYVKSNIGRLSAFCGPAATSGGIAGAIAMINGGSLEVVSDAMTNSLAGISGIFCDGANSSCPLKIANSIYAAYDGAAIALQKNHVILDDGLTGMDIEETITNIGELTHKGMKKTDDCILDIMTRQR